MLKCKKVIFFMRFLGQNRKKQMFNLVSKNSSITCHAFAFNPLYLCIFYEDIINNISMLVHSINAMFILEVALIGILIEILIGIITLYNPSNVPLERIDLGTQLPRPYSNDEMKRRIVAIICRQLGYNRRNHNRNNIYHEYPLHFRLCIDDVR